MFMDLNHDSYFELCLVAFKPIVLYHEAANTVKELKKKNLKKKRKKAANLKIVDDSLFNSLIYMNYSKLQ